MKSLPPSPLPDCKLSCRHETHAEKLDSMGLLTVEDPDDVRRSAIESDEEVSVEFAGSASTKKAFLLGDGGDEEEGAGQEDAWVGGGGGGHSHASEHSHEHGHSHGNGHGNGNGHGSDHGNGSVHGNGHGHHHDANGPGCNGHRGGGAVVGGVEMRHLPGNVIDAAAVGEGNGHSHGHSHGHGHDHGHDHEGDKRGGSGDRGCAGSNGHVHGHADHSHVAGGAGGGGGCGGGGGGGGHGKSMNLWAVLVHAIADAVSSGIVCAQGEAFFFFVCREFFGGKDMVVCLRIMYVVCDC